MNLAIVESHHYVLKAWAEFRSGLAQAPVLLTLDHHTDTSAPFRRHPKGAEQMLKAIDWRKPTTVERAIEDLSNDEHIVAALKTDILGAALVVAHGARNTDLECFQTHAIACREVQAATESDLVLETDFLRPRVEDLLRLTSLELRPGEYIFDIDLDYLNTHQSVQPKDSSYLRDLVGNAGLVTIATEPEYVEHCARESGLNSQKLLESFRQLVT